MRTLYRAAALCAVASLSLTLPAFAADNSVTVPIGAWLDPIIEFIIGVVLAAGATWLVGVLVGFLPQWLRPLVNAAVQAALAGWIRQAINYAIQQVEGFDKDKSISFDVGSNALAVILRFLIEHGPGWLLKLAGGPDKLKAQILAALSDHGIVLDSGVLPAQVAANDNPVLKASGVDSALKQIFTGKKAASAPALSGGAVVGSKSQ